jgi:hypothetical protein
MTNPTPTLHEVLTRGIERALRDLGVDLVGCAPATLTGHIIRELLDAGLHPGRRPTFDHKDVERGAHALHEAMCPCGWGVTGCRRYAPAELREWTDAVLHATEQTR